MKIINVISKTFRLVVACLFFISNQSGVVAQTTAKPNIIFIFTDDLGFGDLGCYGGKVIRTPNLDKMASEGTLFTNFSTSSPVCSPSRAAIMTGQYPVRHEIHYALGNEQHNQEFRMPNYLDPKAEMLTRLLQSGGYKTAHFGKWHLGKTKDSPAPREYGIDESNTHEEGIYDGVKTSDKAKTLIDITIDFIERNKDEAFYINCWISEPHSILAPSNEQLSEYPELQSMAKDFTSATQVYSSVITEVDKQVGRLLDKLDQLGLSENTLVVFTSDNGPSPIFGIDTAHSGTGEVGPFRGCKASLYEGGIRVPFIVRWPGSTPAGKVDDETIISGVDMLPTFCTLAEVDYSARMTPDGQDMSTALKGVPLQRENPLMWEYRYSPWGRLIQDSPVLAIRDGDWKLLMNPDGSRVELYNLKLNLSELDNLASENKNIVKRMSKQLLDWHKSLPNVETINETQSTLNYSGRWNNIFNTNKSE